MLDPEEGLPQPGDLGDRPLDSPEGGLAKLRESSTGQGQGIERTGDRQLDAKPPGNEEEENPSKGVFREKEDTPVSMLPECPEEDGWDRSPSITQPELSPGACVQPAWAEGAIEMSLNAL